MTIEVRGVSVSISNKMLVKDVNLDVQPGETVAIVGPNGAGKSTLLKAMYRLLQPQAGSITLGRQNIYCFSSRDFAQRISVLAQERPSDFNFTVREVVALGRLPHQSFFSDGDQSGAAKIDYCLDQVGLIKQASRAFNTLSGGEQQRALLARALVQDPECLILDEPTNHLDIHYQIEMVKLLRTLDITVITTLHDLNIAAGWADRVVLMSGGTVHSFGAPENVLTKQTIKEVYNVECSISSCPESSRPRIFFKI